MNEELAALKPEKQVREEKSQDSDVLKLKKRIENDVKTQ